MPKLHPMFASSLIMVTLVVGVVLAVQWGWIPGGDIYLEMKVEKSQLQGSKIKLPMTLTLKNPSGRVQYLPPQSTCRIFRWFILDERTAFVQSWGKDQGCLEGTINRGLKPWQEIEEEFTLTLNAKRFKSGKNYYIFVSFWGLQKQELFIAP
jgi:hypothetical protein